MRRLVALALALSARGSHCAVCTEAEEAEREVAGDPSDRRLQRHSTGGRSLLLRQGTRPRQLPPGLAKKNNGCLPPGQAKKRYVVGHSLPHGIVVEELPVELSVRIGPAPAGYRYGILDGDLVKLAVGTLLVVDAIEGLVR